MTEELDGVEPVKKRRRARTNTKRLTTLWLRSLGAIETPLEQRIPGTFITRDGFGFLDTAAILGGTTFGIQYCVSGDASKRVEKVLNHPLFPRVAMAWIVVVVAWRQVHRAFGAPAWEPRVILCKSGDPNEAAERSRRGAGRTGGAQAGDERALAATPSPLRDVVGGPKDPVGPHDPVRRPSNRGSRKDRPTGGPEDPAVT